MQFIHPKSPRAWSFALKVALIEKKKKKELYFFFPGKVFDVFNCIYYLSIAVSHTTSNRCWHKWYYAATSFHQHCSPNSFPPFFGGEMVRLSSYLTLFPEKKEERERNKEKKFTEMTKVTSEKKRAKREQRLKRSWNNDFTTPIRMKKKNKKKRQRNKVWKARSKTLSLFWRWQCVDFALRSVPTLFSSFRHTRLKGKQKKQEKKRGKIRRGRQKESSVTSNRLLPTFRPECYQASISTRETNK